VDATDQTFYPSIRLNTAVASVSCQLPGERHGKIVFSQQTGADLIGVSLEQRVFSSQKGKTEASPLTTDNWHWQLLLTTDPDNSELFHCNL
jgi:hypothetical protein